MISDHDKADGLKKFGVDDALGDRAVLWDSQYRTDWLIHGLDIDEFSHCGGPTERLQRTDTAANEVPDHLRHELAGQFV